MLVVTRKSTESIVIGGSTGFERLLKLTVIGVTGGKVKLGIEVADDVPVQPWEVWQRICAGSPADSTAFGGLPIAHRAGKGISVAHAKRVNHERAFNNASILSDQRGGARLPRVPKRRRKISYR